MNEKELYLHTSNRIESLAERLVQISRTQPLETLLSQETVMTLNPGMARWLRFKIAQSQGIAFGWEFPFPGVLFERILTGFDRAHKQNGIFDENLARWELFDLLETLENTEQFARLRQYCDSGPARRFQMASKLAWLYDQYLLYRPDTIVDWETGRDHSNWQGELWRRLLPRVFPNARRPQHIARIWQTLRLSKSDHVNPSLSDWPDRIALFGVSALPPLYLDILEVVSRFRPVHIFLLQPSDMYWADLKSRKQIARTSERIAAETPEFHFDENTFEIGNPLLPSFGKQGQAFLDLILDKDPVQDDAAFIEPTQSTQLSCLQSDLFRLESRIPPDSSQYPFPNYDGTILIHRSSNSRREIESLWDNLVDYFATHPNADANDILVMAPDIQDYAGHIESVFANDHNDDPSIPFSIADQSGTQESSFLSGLIEYLELATDRASANQILGLLKLPLTREAFDFTDSDIERIEFWIRETGVTWGWDADHRKSFDAFPTRRNTWSEFQTRLSAGMAYIDETELIPGDLSPFCELEGQSAELAGRFIEFLKFHERLKDDCKRTDSVASWAQYLCSTLDRLKPSDEFEQSRFNSAIETLQTSLPALASVATNGQEAIACALQALQNSSPSGGYLSGRVTFCSLKPMRSIPAKVICLLGMNSDRFPRKSIRSPFDLLSENPRRGDRNTRDEDKQFFLETILATREQLFISYKGLSSVNDGEHEPSIVVTELRDYLETAQPENRHFLAVTHKRRSYDPEYFKNTSLFTYSSIRANNCQTYLNRISTPDPQRTEPPSLSELESSKTESSLSIDAFIRFFKDPQKTFIQSTLGARFPSMADALPDSDDLQQNPLSRYKLRDRFAKALREGEPIGSINQASIASLKLLPPGHLERLSYETLSNQAMQIETIWNHEGISEHCDTLSIDVTIANFRLTGQLRRNCQSNAQYFIHPGKLNAKTHIDFWIRHLLANAIQPQTTWIYSLHENSASIKFPPTLEATGILDNLLGYYRQGLARPIPFLPQLSWDALARLDNARYQIADANPENALIETSHYLFGTNTQYGDFAPKYPWDIYAQTCFGETPIFNNAFAAVSLGIWSPCRAALNLEGVTS